VKEGEEQDHNPREGLEGKHCKNRSEAGRSVKGRRKDGGDGGEKGVVAGKKAQEQVKVQEMWGV